MKPRPFLTILTAALCAAPLAAQPAKKAVPLPEGAIARLGESHFFHPTTVMALDFSPDGATIVTGTQDGTMFLWDVAGGFERARWRQDMSNDLVSVRYSPNGRLIASTSSNGSLFVWTADGKRVYSRPNQRYEPLAFNWMPDNQRLVTAGRAGAVIFHDVVAGRELNTFNTAMPNIVAIALSPDGKRFALRDQSGRMKGFEIDGSKSIVTFDDGTTGSRYMRPNSLFRFAPDNTTLMTEATGGGSNAGPTLWDATTGKVIRRIDSAVSGYMWTATANGKFLAASSPSDGRLRVVGVTSGLEIRSIDGAGPITQGMAFSPDGKRLAAIVGGQALRVWDMDGGEPMHQNTGHASPVTALAFLKDGRLVSTGADRTVRAWDVRAGKEIERDTIQSYFYGMVPEPDGAGVLMTAETILHRWRPGEGLTTGAALPSNIGGNSALAPDASAVVLSTGQQLHVFSLPDGKAIKKLDMPLNTHVQNFALAPRGRFLAYVESSNHGAIHVYDLKRDRARKPIFGDAANVLHSERLLFSPDGRFYASVNANRATMVWEAGTGLVRALLPRGDERQAGTFAAAFSPDGRILALGLQSGAIYLYDMRTGQSTPVFAVGPVETIDGGADSRLRRYSHRAGILQVAFSHDGMLLASGGQDQSILVWDVKKLLAKLPAKPPVASPTAAQLDAWWHSLASTEGKAVSEAVWSLAAVPATALELFEARLKPAHGPDPAALARWVVELGDAKFTVRENAQRRLAAAGASAYAALTEGLRASDSAEARTRLTRLIDAIDSQYSPERLRPLRALEVLEKIATPAARAQVERLATNASDPELKDEAQRVLERWNR